MADPGKKTTQSTEPLLPDLCRAQSMLGALLAAMLLALFIALVKNGLSQFDLVEFGKISLLAFWSALLSVFFLCRSRRYLVRLSLPRATLASYVLILLAVVLTASVASLWLSYTAAATGAVDFWLVIDITVVAAIPAGVVLRMFYLQQQIYRRHQAALQSRLEALQSRIRPHFLFNSMNILASLIAEDPEKAEKTVEDLSDLFRYALSDNNNQVTLGDEIEACECYLALEKLRLEERLSYGWDIQVDVRQIVVPPLILQPLVENAVFHGIQPDPDGGDLSVRICADGDWIEIIVENSLPDELAGSTGHQLAVDNLRHRLDAFFDHQATLQAGAEAGRYRSVVKFKPREGDYQ